MSVSPHDEALDRLYETRELSLSYPETFKALKEQKAKEERVLPRGLRRAYRSKNKSLIEDQIKLAMKDGFTFEEIRQDFDKWKASQEFVE